MANSDEPAAQPPKAAANRGVDPAPDAPKTNREMIGEVLGKPLPNPAKNPGPPRKAAPAGSQGWKPSKIAALQIAKQMDARLAGLRNAFGDIRVIIDFPDGSRASSEARLFVKDPKTFYLESVALGSDQPGKEVFGYKLISDGRYVTEYTPAGWSSPVPLNRRKTAEAPPSRWPREFTRVAFAGLGTGKAVWTNLIKACARPGSGLSVRSEERETKVGSRNVLTRRLLVSRSAAETKRHGPLSMEIIVSGSRNLPVTIRTSEARPGAKPRDVLWSTYWTLDQPGGMPSERFVLPVAPPGKRA